MTRRNPTDDRGKPCGIAELSRRQLGWRMMGLGSKTPDEHVRREQPMTQAYDVAVAIAGGIVGLFVWKYAVTPVLPGGGFWWGTFAYVVFVPAFATAAWVLVLPEIRRRRFGRISEIYLDAGRCAGCGYELKDLTPEGDGCVVCPECHAAWRADRLG